MVRMFQARAPARRGRAAVASGVGVAWLVRRGFLQALGADSFLFRILCKHLFLFKDQARMGKLPPRA